MTDANATRIRHSPWDRRALTSLRKVLADLFPQQTDQRRLVKQVGLREPAIAFDPAANNSWFAILDHASKFDGRVDALLEAALEEYPDNETLRGFTEPAPPPPATAPSSPRKRSSLELEALAGALLSAFPTRSALAQMLRFKLDRKLDEIAAASNQKSAVFELVTTAEAQGWIDDLLGAALAEVPNNPDLQALASTRRA